MLRKPFLFLFFICGWLCLSAQSTNCSFGLVLTSSQVAAGETFTIDVTTRQFNDLLALQYNHSWDPQKLNFIEVIYNPMLAINATNFNQTPALTQQGLLNFVFLVNNLSAFSLPDSSILYSLRFTKLTNEEATVATSGNNLPVELIDAAFNFVENYYFVHATVGEADGFPELNSGCLVAPNCAATTSGSITLAATGATPLAFSWTGPAGFSSTANALTGLTGGTYQLTLTDNPGRQVQGDFYLGNPTDLQLTLTVDADECGGSADGGVTSSVTGGSGNYTYNWSNGQTTANLTNVPADTYSLTLTDGTQGCTTTATATVTGTAGFLVYYQTTPASCTGNADGGIAVQAEAPADLLPLNYLWSTGATTASISGLASGIYTVTVTASNADACTQVFVIPLAAQNLTFDAEVVDSPCGAAEGGSITILRSETDYTFSWSNGSTAAALTNLPNGDYTVTVTENTTGCSAEASYTLQATGLLTGQTITCFTVNDTEMADLSVVVWNAEQAPFTFAWSNGETAVDNRVSTLTVPANQTFSVTITSATGCVEVVDNISSDCGVFNGVQLNLNPAVVAVNTGEAVCLSLTASNFTAINGFQFTLNWDESQLAFTGLQNLYLPGLDAANFGFEQTSDGRLTVAWLSPDVTNGITLPMNALLFDLCWEVTGTDLTTTAIGVSGIPTPVEFVNANNSIVPATWSDTQVLLNGYTPDGSDGDLVFSLDTLSVAANGYVCLPLRVNGFADIAGLQMTLGWNPNALQYVGVRNFNLAGLTTTNFSSLAEAQQEGQLRVLWSDYDLSGETLPNGAVLFEVCYNALGPVGTYPVSFLSAPLPTEVANNEFQLVPSMVHAGAIRIDEEGGSQDSASLRISSLGTAPGESFCVPVEVETFAAIVGMQFSIVWDNNLLQFNSLNVTESLPGLTAANFFVPPGQNHLTCSWIAGNLQNQTLSAGTTLFELCFTAQPTEGIAAIVFSNVPTAIEFIRGNTLLPFIAINGQITISSDGFVWPGDTNANGLADHFDLLPIGLSFNAAGAVRANASLNWQAQYAEPWSEETPVSAVNYRHIDTNGDGIINATDTLALRNNWGLATSNLTGGGTFSQGFLNGIPFYVQPDTVQAGATVSLPIQLGTIDEPVTDAYGIAFSIVYDPEMVVPGSPRLRFNGWLGGAEDGLLGMYRDVPDAGRIDVAMVRTDAQNTSGHGTIGELVIIMEDVILRGLVDVEVPIRIENVQLISYQEVGIPTAPITTQILVENVTNIEELDPRYRLQVAPNPTNGQFALLLPGLQVEKVTVYNANGQVVQTFFAEQTTYDLATQPAGTYFLAVQTNHGVAHQKLVKY